MSYSPLLTGLAANIDIDNGITQYWNMGKSFPTLLGKWGMDSPF